MAQFKPKSSGSTQNFIMKYILEVIDDPVLILKNQYASCSVWTFPLMTVKWSDE